MKLLYIVLFSLYLLLTFTPLFLAQQHQIDLTSDVYSVSFTSSEEIAQINSKSSTTTKKSNSASKSEKSSESKSSKKSDKSKKNATTSKTNQPQPPPLVNINPSYLDFDESPLCMPKVENVEIINKSPTEEVQLISLASDSDSFSSFVKSQIIPPKGSLNITVIFLPRRIGVLDNNLVIQTTMTGTGIANAFRVAPIIGKKVSEGGVLMSHIDFYNPFSAPINVSDIFTHGGFLQLSNTENSEPISVMPYTETRIVSLMFSSNNTGKFVGSVNIRSSKGDIIVPMEVDVVKDVVYASPDVLDWGVLHNQSNTLALPLNLLNAFNQPILVKHIQSSGDLPFTLPFSPIVIPPGVETTIANLTWIFAKEGKFEGKITVLTNASRSHSSSIEVPYKANVVHGILKYGETNNSFSIKEINKGIISKAVIITNKFNSPMLIYSIDLVDSLFTIETYTPILFPLVVNPSSTVKLIAKYIGPLPLYSTYYCSILVSSNISIAEIPLSIFEGKLQVGVDEHTGLQVESKGESIYGVDLGAIATNDIQIRRIEISNSNPRSIPIYSLKSNMDQVVVKIEKILNKQNKIVNTTQPQKPKRKLSENAETTSILTMLESGHTLIMRIEIASPKEEQISGEIIMTTEYETMVFELKYQSVEGSLYMVPSSLKFPEKGFPGHSQKLSLQIKSTYSRPIQITTITTQSPVFVPFLTELSIAPNEITDIGYLLFDPSQLSDEDNYMKTPSYIDNVSANGQILTKNDLAAFKYREFIWHSLLYSDATTIHSPLTINTNVNNPLQIPITGYLSKPSIFYEEELDFTIVQIDNYLDRVLLVQNPSDQYVYVELLPLMNNKIFTVLDDQLPKKILLPHSTDVLTTVRFVPSQQNIQYSANLYLKNNLTILDSIVLKGEGGAGILMLQSPDKSPEDQIIMEDSKLLVFELTAQQLSNCKVNEFPGTISSDMQQQQQQQQPSTLHMVQSFLAVNKGNLPISIQSMSINGKPCSGYGFDIEECSEFTLEPSEHRNVTIHYTPREFHSPLIKHQLIVDTNQGPQLFTLIINIPFEYLSLCSNLQPQIQFESFVYKLLVSFIVLILTFLGFLTKRELVINLESCTIFENIHSSNIDSTIHSDTNTSSSNSSSINNTSKPQIKTPTPPSTPQVSPAPPQATVPAAPNTLLKEPQQVNKSADSLGEKPNDVPLKKRSGSESDKRNRNRKGSSAPSMHSSAAPVPPSTSATTTTTTTTKEKKKKDKQSSNSSENTSGLRVINNPNAKFQIIEDFPSIVKKRPKSKQNKATPPSTVAEDNVSGTVAVDSLVDSGNVDSTNTTLDDSGALDRSSESLSTSHENCFDVSSDRDEPSKPNINNSSTPPLTPPIRHSENLNKLNRDIYRDYEILNSSDEEMFSLNNSFDSYDGIAPLNSILDTPVKPSSTTSTSTAVGVIGSGKAPKATTNPFGQYTAPPPAPLPFDPSIISYSTRNNYFSFGGGVPTSSLFSQPFLPPTTTATNPSNTSYFSFAPPAPVNPNRERSSSNSYQLFDSTTTSNDHMSPFQRFNPQ